MDGHHMARRVAMAEVSRAGMRETDVGLDVWCEGGLGQEHLSRKKCLPLEPANQSSTIQYGYRK